MAKKKNQRALARRIISGPKPIGVVTHFYDHISVAIVKFKKSMKVGAHLIFRHGDHESHETITSMQYDHMPITVAHKGQEVGIRVRTKVKEGYDIFEDT